MTVVTLDSLPIMDVAGRAARVRSRFDDAGIDALLVTHLPNVRYLTGFTGSSAMLLVTTEERMYPIVLGIKRLLYGESYIEWNVVMATSILAMLPPAAVVMLMQKWFVKGLVDTEK